MCAPLVLAPNALHDGAPGTQRRSCWALRSMQKLDLSMGAYVYLPSPAPIAPSFCVIAARRQRRSSYVSNSMSFQLRL